MIIQDALDGFFWNLEHVVSDGALCWLIFQGHEYKFKITAWEKVMISVVFILLCMVVYMGDICCCAGTVITRALMQYKDAILPV